MDCYRQNRIDRAGSNQIEFDRIRSSGSNSIAKIEYSIEFDRARSNMIECSIEQSNIAKSIRIEARQNPSPQ